MNASNVACVPLDAVHLWWSREAASEQLKVLVADDEEPVRSLLGAVLEERGDCRWSAAVDGDEAFRKISTWEPDVLIADLDMPQIRGELLAERARVVRPEMAVVIETGKPSLEGAVDLMRHGVTDFITKPFHLEDLQARLDRVFDLSRRRREDQAVDVVVDSLITALGVKDAYLRRHSRRVSKLAALLASDLGIRGYELDRLAWAALVHDVGKIGTPEGILHKPARLTEEEFAEIRRHPEMSEEIVRPLARLRGGEPAVRTVRHHHERIDGHGYPDGLAGDAIPLHSRIIAVCDTYDALSSDRPYRRACEPDAVRAILLDARGTQLEGDLVDTFLTHVESYERHVLARRDHA